MEEKLRKDFLSPLDEFTPIPFWFWNDELQEKEIERQIEEFCKKGVKGFVIHPRKGIPQSIPYLSDVFMHYVKFAVEEAKKRNMKVVLYDEAMYPSGSAHGLVVKENPEYATRALRMEEGSSLPKLEEGETLLAIVTGRQSEDGLLEAHTLREISEDELPVEAQNLTFFLIETYSRGTIRGMHIGEDDLEKDAPASADLLNPQAMESFIRITYDRYYEVLNSYFGNTVIGMFTDEPCVLGRCHRPDVQAWTVGLGEEWKQSGGRLAELPLLWRESDGTYYEEVRRRYRTMVYKRLCESYYRQLSSWCEKHDIALTGHPENSDDMGVLQYFHIPGQDVVWRWVAPENESRIVGNHSTMGKCSSDAARHYGRRRNSNECFGCCSPAPYHWSFTADDMKWYMDWLFVRGVNLLYPHAFFYSIDGEERFGERPPDVGPNNLFWPHYEKFADYVKRMCWLMTDSYNTTPIAILGEEAHLPWEPAKELFEKQIEFNYLEDNLLLSDKCHILDGTIQIEKQSYRVLLADSRVVDQKMEVKKRLDHFVETGGRVILWDLENDLTALLDEYRELRIISGCKTEDIRISHVVKENTDFYLLVNEGDQDFIGIAEIPYSALGNGVGEYQVEYWKPWEGTQTRANSITAAGALHVPVTLRRRESLMLYIGKRLEVALSQQFELGDWTKREDLAEFSGTVTYQCTICCEKPQSQVVLDLGEVHEIATVKINNQIVATRMWAPYRFDIGEALQVGENTVQIEVSNTPANQLEKAGLISGMLGPVKLIGYEI